MRMRQPNPGRALALPSLRRRGSPVSGYDSCVHESYPDTPAKPRAVATPRCTDPGAGPGSTMLSRVVSRSFSAVALATVLGCQAENRELPAPSSPPASRHSVQVSEVAESAVGAAADVPHTGPGSLTKRAVGPEINAAAAPLPNSVGSHNHSHDDDRSVREAAVRHLISARPRAGQIYFLFFDGEADPDEQFLRRLNGAGVIVRRGSQAAAMGVDDGVEPLYRDRITHEPGIRVDVANLQWQDNVEVKVFAQWTVNGLHAEGAILVMRRSGARWTVVRTEGLLVSLRQRTGARVHGVRSVHGTRAGRFRLA